MSIQALIRDPLSDDSFRMAGMILLRAALMLGLLLVGFGAWKSPSILVAIPIVCLAGAVGWWLFGHPLANLAVLLASFVLIADFEDGIQVTEVIFGLYFVAFQAHFVVTRYFLYEEPIFDRLEARILPLFFALLGASAVLTVVFRGDPRLFVGEAFSLSFLSLYYPVREAVTRHRQGATVVLAVIAWIGLFVLLRNLVNYRQILVEATMAWQVAKGRAVTNEALMMIPSFFALIFLVHAETVRRKLILGGLFGLFFGGLILTQSRGYWVAFLAAGIFLLLQLSGTHRRRLVGIGVSALVGLIVVGYAVLGEHFILIASGLLDRILSIGTAASSDISLVNRLRETAVVWDRVLENPILGHGMGVTFRFYDLTYIPPFTHVTSFLHNGYLALWFKFGIWGLGLVLTFWGLGAWRGLQAFRLHSARPFLRLVGLGVAVSLSAFVLTAITSNPFYINDTMFLFGVLTGLAAGVLDRSRLEISGEIAPGASIG